MDLDASSAPSGIVMPDCTTGALLKVLSEVRLGPTQAQ